MRVRQTKAAVEPTRAPSGFGESISPARPVGWAEAPRAPRLPAALVRALADRAAEVRRREGDERRSVLRGLIVLALMVLLIGLSRAGMERVFPEGWLLRW